jgi:hypothetical protein
MQVLAVLCILQLAGEVPPPSALPASRPRLQFEFGAGVGVWFGTMHAVSPGVGTAIGTATRFQNDGTASQAHLEPYLVTLDFNLRIGDIFRVGVRSSNLFPGLFDNLGELLARLSFEIPPGLRYDGPQFSVVPVLWLGTGYAVANDAAAWRLVWRPGWALDASAALEWRWKGGGFLQVEVGYRALLSWRQEFGADAESAPVRFSSPAYSDGVHVGLTAGVRFPAF